MEAPTFIRNTTRFSNGFQGGSEHGKDSEMFDGTGEVAAVEEFVCAEGELILQCSVDRSQVHRGSSPKDPGITLTFATRFTAPQTLAASRAEAFGLFSSPIFSCEALRFLHEANRRKAREKPVHTSMNALMHASSATVLPGTPNISPV
jgi:hypothetical protein